MEYRQLPRGGESISTLGLGFGSIHTAGAEQAYKMICLALEGGINFFDLCCSRKDMFEVFGRAVKGCREKVYTQMHFGAVYPTEDYAFSRDLSQVKASFEEALTLAGMDYTDFGYIHCIDEQSDLDSVMSEGLFDYIRLLKKQGVVRHIGFSSHNTDISRQLLETGEVDMFMFSINPAYDYTKGEYSSGATDERAALYIQAQRQGVGISVMKPFAGGQLLDIKRSPLNVALSQNACLQYALDRPAVLTVVPGVTSEAEVESLLNFHNSDPADRDYSAISEATPSAALGSCVYCNHCAPCPGQINIGLANKYFDLAGVGDELAKNHYLNLSYHASDCISCGHCESRCPFGVKQISRMARIKEYFGI